MIAFGNVKDVIKDAVKIIDLREGYSMLIYISDSKINNLMSEKKIRNKYYDIICKLGINKVSISKTHKNTELSASLETNSSNSQNNKESDVSSVLRYLEKKGSLLTLKPDSIINKNQYIHSFGTLKYIKAVDGRTASNLKKEDLNSIRGEYQFFDDDILHFEINISHNVYQCISIKMTAKNVEVFGGMNLRIRHQELFKEDIMLRHPNSADPGIIYGDVYVEFIILVTDIDYNNNRIVGSPVIIYS